MTAHAASTQRVVLADVPLGPLTTLGVGGRARWFLEAPTEQDAGGAVEWARFRGLPLWLLGGGSNVVVPDEGLDGLVLRIAIRGISEAPHGDCIAVTAAAGEPWDGFVARMVARGLAGLECLSGIPGLVGATPIQNVGAYGQDVAETIVSVRVLDREERRVRVLAPEECGFTYRDSVFKNQAKDRYVVLAVTFALSPDGVPRVRHADVSRRLAESTHGAAGLADVRRTVLAIRAEKSMVLEPTDPNRRSCGSFFMNPTVPPELADRVATLAGVEMPRYPGTGGRVKLSAAWLIERVGFEKGHRHGAVGLSSKHALAIVAHDGATAKDVLGFARLVRERVRERLGIELEPEPNLWGAPHGLA